MTSVVGPSKDDDNSLKPLDRSYWSVKYLERSEYLGGLTFQEVGNHLGFVERWDIYDECRVFAIQYCGRF